MELSVYNVKGQETGRKVTLNDSIFGIEPNDHVIYLAVKQYMANNRQGTHKSKERSEISGSTKKLGRQKGGGGARRGDINSPDKKVKKLARKSALAYKAKENAIIVVENFDFEAPKTKDYVAFTENLKVSDKKNVLVLSEPNKNVSLSAKNLQKSQVLLTHELNTYKILDAKCLLLTEAALAELENTLKD